MDLRYVVLHHTGYGQPHYDLMCETAPHALLLTIRLSEWPITAATRRERLPDHRRIYLDYEGPVSNNRGHVHRVESGACTISPERITLIRSDGPTEIPLS